MNSHEMSREPLTVEHLERWALAGAHWRVVEIASEHAVVELCACTGEPVERRQSNNRALIAYLTTTPTDLEIS